MQLLETLPLSLILSCESMRSRAFLRGDVLHDVQNDGALLDTPFGSEEYTVHVHVHDVCASD